MLLLTWFHKQKPEFSVGLHFTFKLEAWGRRVNSGYSHRQPQPACETNLQKNKSWLSTNRCRDVRRGIWHSWLDRDLSLAGRVVVADKNGSFSAKLIKIDRPLIRIPTLAIHRRSPSRTTFPF